MKQVFAFNNKEDFDRYQDKTVILYQKLDVYRLELEKNFGLTELPRGIVWTTHELATTTFSTIPIPAFTSRELIFMSPDLASWRKLFLEQLEGQKNEKIEAYYKNLKMDHIATILGHELTHHSDLFVDEFGDEREDGIWFEEGMCEYIPRKLMLSPLEFSEIVEIELELMKMFRKKYGSHSINDFGQGSYEGSLTSIMFDYWRSFLAIRYLVEEQAGGDIMSVFGKYQQWNQEGRKVPLSEHFNVESMFSL